MFVFLRSHLHVVSNCGSGLSSMGSSRVQANAPEASIIMPTLGIPLFQITSVNRAVVIVKLKHTRVLPTQTFSPSPFINVHLNPEVIGN